MGIYEDLEQITEILEREAAKQLEAEENDFEPEPDVRAPSLQQYDPLNLR